EGFKINLIADGEAWMDMLQSRNRTSHSYDEDTAEEIIQAILTRYVSRFDDLLKSLSEKE
ncbi:MAG: nucleotidyltransferase substrate binding protein, partial [Bacteroidales bacterium]|nr:nucleotidyltransferase substrate binding protein [Bacteroidales bacterium]